MPKGTMKYIFEPCL